MSAMTPFLLGSSRNLQQSCREKIPALPNRKELSRFTAANICRTTVNPDGTCSYEFVPDLEAQTNEAQIQGDEYVQDALIQLPCEGMVITSFVPADDVDPTAIHVKSGDRVKVTKMTNDAAWFYAEVLDSHPRKEGLLPRSVIGKLTTTEPAVSKDLVMRNIPEPAVIYNVDVAGGDKDKQPESEGFPMNIWNHFKGFCHSEENTHVDKDIFVHQEKHASGGYIKLRNHSEIPKTEPVLGAKWAYTELRYDVGAKDCEELKARGLMIDAVTGRLQSSEENEDKTVNMTCKKDEDEFKVTIRLFDREVRVSETQLTICVHDDRTKHLTSLGLGMALLLAGWVQWWYIIGDLDETYTGGFLTFMKSVLYGTFCAYCMCFILYTSMVCGETKSKRLLKKICLCLSVVQFQFYLGHIAYRIPHMVKYKPGPRLVDESSHFVSPCFQSHTDRCPDKLINWKADLDDIAWSQATEVLGPSKMKGLDLVRPGVVTVAGFVFSNMFFGGKSRILLDLPDVDDFFGLMLEEKVLITFWGSGDGISMGNTTEHGHRHDGHLGMYTMPDSKTTYRIKDHPSFSEFWWNAIFLIFMVGAIKASVQPLVLMLNPYRGMYKHKQKSKSPLVTPGLVLFEVLNLVLLDLPFLIMRVLMIWNFDIASSIFLSKNIIFCIISLLRIFLVTSNNKSCLPPAVQEFVLGEIDWLESQYSAGDCECDTSSTSSSKSR